MYQKKFLENEEGIETIEFVALLAVAAILIGIVAKIGTTLAAKGNAVDGQITDALNAVGGGQ